MFRSALGQHPAILEYQVRQTPRGATIAVVATGTVDPQGIQVKLTAALEAVGLADVHVAVETVDVLRRQASGKLKRFVPLAD